ncbi:MAG: hypothetical protein H0W34_14090 [Pyrinomonadaceae bacterium]|nr:hypothetical protein [Pyrinomonadaceae bacterium]
MSDEELEQRLEAVLREISEDELRAMARKHPDLFTPEVLENELASIPQAREVEGH